MVWGHSTPKVKNWDEDESHVNWYLHFEEPRREETKTKKRQNLREMSARRSTRKVVGWVADQWRR